MTLFEHGGMLRSCVASPDWFSSRPSDARSHARNRGCDRRAGRNRRTDARYHVDADVSPVRIPFTTTGTTPTGSLDDVRFLGVELLGGFCEPGYYPSLFRTDDPGEDAALVVRVPLGSANRPTGTIAVHAFTFSGSYVATDDATFDVVHVDLPQSDVGPGRVAGHAQANAAEWKFDFSVDGSALPVNCI